MMRYKIVLMLGMNKFGEVNNANSMVMEVEDGVLQFI